MAWRPITRLHMCMLFAEMYKTISANRHAMSAAALLVGREGLVVGCVAWRTNGHHDPKGPCTQIGKNTSKLLRGNLLSSWMSYTCTLGLLRSECCGSSVGWCCRSIGCCARLGVGDACGTHTRRKLGGPSSLRSGSHRLPRRGPPPPPRATARFDSGSACSSPVGCFDHIHVAEPPPIS